MPEGRHQHGIKSVQNLVKVAVVKRSTHLDPIVCRNQLATRLDMLLLLEKEVSEQGQPQFAPDQVVESGQSQVSPFEGGEVAHEAEPYRSGARPDPADPRLAILQTIRQHLNFTTIHPVANEQIVHIPGWGDDLSCTFKTFTQEGPAVFNHFQILFRPVWHRLIFFQTLAQVVKITIHFTGTMNTADGFCGPLAKSAVAVQHLDSRAEKPVFHEVDKVGDTTAIGGIHQPAPQVEEVEEMNHVRFFVLQKTTKRCLCQGRGILGSER